MALLLLVCCLIIFPVFFWALYGVLNDIFLRLFPEFPHLALILMAFSFIVSAFRTAGRVRELAKRIKEKENHEK